MSNDWWHEQAKDVWDPRNEGDHRPLEIVMELDRADLALIETKPMVRSARLDWSKDEATKAQVQISTE